MDQAESFRRPSKNVIPMSTDRVNPRKQRSTRTVQHTASLKATGMCSISEMAEHVLPLPAAAISLQNDIQSVPAEGHGVLHRVKGAYKKLNKAARHSWRQQQKAQGAKKSSGDSILGEQAAGHHGSHQKVEALRLLTESNRKKKEEILAIKEQDRIQARFARDHSSPDRSRGRSQMYSVQAFSGAKESLSRSSSPGTQHQPVLSPERPWECIQNKQAEDVLWVQASMNHERKKSTHGVSLLGKTKAKAKVLPATVIQYIKSVLMWERLAGQHYWKFLAENARNRNDTVWHIFTYHKDPDRPNEEYKLDVHTPDIYRFPKDGKPSEFLSSADAAYAAEHWMLTMQEHKFRDLPSKGVTIVTGVGRDTGARNHTAILNLLISLQQEGALVRTLQGQSRVVHSAPSATCLGAASPLVLTMIAPPSLDLNFTWNASHGAYCHLSRSSSIFGNRSVSHGTDMRNMAAMSTVARSRQLQCPSCRLAPLRSSCDQRVTALQSVTVRHDLMLV